MFLTYLEGFKLFNSTKSVRVICELLRVIICSSTRRFYYVKYNNEAQKTCFRKLLFYTKQLS